MENISFTNNVIWYFLAAAKRITGN